MKIKTIIIYLFVFFLFFLCLHVYYQYNNVDLKCIISKVDGKRYCVRDRVLLQDAVDLLAKVVEKLKKLVDHMKHKYPQNAAVQRLVQNFDPKKISETLPTSELTAFTENKGEKIAVCLNRAKHSSTLIDINTLTFVAIHEISHVMTKSEDHLQEFWNNFKWMLENAVDIHIIHPVDYKNTPQSYCGMIISDNPFYDL